MLEVNSVTRQFGDLVALDNVSLRVEPGRMTGFVGANGAGKTTAMRIVMGVMNANAGTVTFGGKPLDLEMRRQFGYMPEERGLYPKMKVLDQLVYLGQLHGISKATATARAELLLDQLGLGERTGDLLTTLSLGNQQRAQIAAALVHDPNLLILDEPFSGLDPIAVDTMISVLEEHVAVGVPVLFSSHQLDLVERICHDVIIIDHGKIIAAGDAAELRAAHVEPTVQLTMADDAEWVREVPGLRVLEVSGPTALVMLNKPDDDQLLLRAAMERGSVREMRRVVPTLAEIFREVIQ